MGNGQGDMVLQSGDSTGNTVTRLDGRTTVMLLDRVHSAGSNSTGEISTAGGATMDGNSDPTADLPRSLDERHLQRLKQQTPLDDIRVLNIEHTEDMDEYVLMASPGEAKISGGKVALCDMPLADDQTDQQDLISPQNETRGGQGIHDPHQAQDDPIRILNRLGPLSFQRAPPDVSGEEPRDSKFNGGQTAVAFSSNLQVYRPPINTPDGQSVIINEPAEDRGSTSQETSDIIEDRCLATTPGPGSIMEHGEDQMQRCITTQYASDNIDLQRNDIIDIPCQNHIPQCQEGDRNSQRTPLNGSEEGRPTIEDMDPNISRNSTPSEESMTVSGPDSDHTESDANNADVVCNRMTSQHSEAPMVDFNNESTLANISNEITRPLPTTSDTHSPVIGPCDASVPDDNANNVTTYTRPPGADDNSHMNLTAGLVQDTMEHENITDMINEEAFVILHEEEMTVGRDESWQDLAGPEGSAPNMDSGSQAAISSIEDDLDENHFADAEDRTPSPDGSQDAGVVIEGSGEPTLVQASAAPRESLPPSVGQPSSNGSSIPTTPPPTYAECMRDAVPLSFVDFWPQCISLGEENFIFSRFEHFDRVMAEANMWLQEHPQVVVRNCETVEIKASSLDEFILNTSSKTSTCRSTFRPLLYIKGLRVWYSSKIIDKLPFAFAVTPCMLSYINIRPSTVNNHNGVQYERFPSLIDRCNTLIRCGLINGRILNVETVCAKEPEPEDGKIIGVAVDPDKSSWRDTYAKVALTFLRVYYLPEQPVTEKLHFKDFLPEYVRRSRHHPKYRDFSTVMDDCRLWLVHLDSQYRLVNAQTLETAHFAKQEGQLDTHYCFYHDYEGVPRVRFLRVYYANEDVGVEYGVPLLSHKTFLPGVIKKRRHETLATLMQRVESWLRATGASVVCVETLPILEQAFHEKGNGEGSLYRSEWMDANTEYDHEMLLYIVRVYLDTVYPEPPPQIFLDGEDPYDEDCVLL